MPRRAMKIIRIQIDKRGFLDLIWHICTIVRSAVPVTNSCYPSVQVASYPTVQCCLWCVACVHCPAGPGCRSRSQLRLSQWPGTAWVAWAADWVIQTQWKHSSPWARHARTSWPSWRYPDPRWGCRPRVPPPRCTEDHGTAWPRLCGERGSGLSTKVGVSCILQDNQQKQGITINENEINIA